MPEELIGQGDVQRGRYSEVERREQILRYLSDGKIRTTSEVARALKMQASTHLRRMLGELYAEKKLLAYSEIGMYRWQKPQLFQMPFDFDDMHDQREAK